MNRIYRPVLIALMSVLSAFAASAAAVIPGSGARPWSLDGQMAFVRMPSLETSAVTAIAQDTQGFLWFGTQSNLLRWDGYQLRTYARDPDAAGSLPDNFIRSLLVDDRGQLWVGSNSGGLSRYDPQTDGFTSFPVGANGTSDGTISVLISDHRGGLWIGTGHGAGDAVLVEVAERLRALLRETDLAARLGGDEFCVILANPRDTAAVDSACTRIIKRLGEPIILADRTVVIGASIGVATVPHGRVTTPDELHKSADTALYEAKRGGRNTWRWDNSSAVSATATGSWKRSMTKLARLK
jgi:diguanylate cyclase (GGDEF)-like protein